MDILIPNKFWRTVATTTFLSIALTACGGGGGGSDDGSANTQTPPITGGNNTDGNNNDGNNNDGNNNDGNNNDGNNTGNIQLSGTVTGLAANTSITFADDQGNVQTITSGQVSFNVATGYVVTIKENTSPARNGGEHFDKAAQQYRSATIQKCELINANSSGQITAAQTLSENTALDVTCAQRMVFQKGNELWATDGTSAQRIEVIPNQTADIGFLTLKNKAYFITNNNALWETDGTTASQIVANVQSATVLNNKIYYFHNVSSSSHLIKSFDGADTETVSDLGTAQLHSQLASVNGSLFYILKDSNNYTVYQRKDNAVKSSTLQANPVPGNKFYATNTTVFFTARDNPSSADNQQKLWYFNNVANNFAPVTNVYNPTNISALDDKVLFAAQSQDVRNVEPWVATRATNGTVTAAQVKDIAGPISSFSGVNFGSHPHSFVQFQNKYYFIAHEEDTHNNPINKSLWVSTNLNATTTIKLNPTGISLPTGTDLDNVSLVVDGGYLYIKLNNGDFIRFDGTNYVVSAARNTTTAGQSILLGNMGGKTLYVVDGMLQSYQASVGNIVSYLNHGATPPSSYVLKGTLTGLLPNSTITIKNLANGDYEDITENGQFTISSLSPNAQYNVEVTAVTIPPDAEQNSERYYKADRDLRQILASVKVQRCVFKNQDAQGKVVGTANAPVSVLHELNIHCEPNILFQTQSTAAAAKGLWRFDGKQPHPVKALSGISVVSGDTANGFTIFKNKAYFAVGNDIYVTDGTEPGTKRAIQGGKNALVIGQKLYYIDNSGGVSYFDGTTTQTAFESHQVNGTIVSHLVLSNAELYFIVDSGSAIELVKCNASLCNAPTVVASYAGHKVQAPVNYSHYLASFSNKVYFSTYEPQARVLYKLMVSDGTSAGTSIVASSSNGTAYNPMYFQPINNTLFVAASNLTGNASTGNQGSNYELWVITNTSATMHDINNNHEYRSYPENFVNFGGRLYFSASNTQSTADKKLRHTDGTTVQVYTGKGSSAVSYPTNAQVIGDNLYIRKVAGEFLVINSNPNTNEFSSKPAASHGLGNTDIGNIIGDIDGKRYFQVKGKIFELNSGESTFKGNAF